LSYCVFALFLGNYPLLLLLVAFMGSVAGFWVFNKPAARIYMGDSGSLFLGGFLACVPFAISWSEYNDYGYFVPLIVSAVPLLECGTLILVRTYKSIPFYLGSPDHFSIFLRERGWSKWAVLGLSVIATVVSTFLAVLLFLNIVSIEIIFCCGAFLVFLWYLNLVS